HFQDHVARQHFAADHQWGDQFDPVLSAICAASAAGDCPVAHAHVPGGDCICHFLLEPGGERAAGIASGGGDGECNSAAGFGGGFFHLAVREAEAGFRHGGGQLRGAMMPYWLYDIVYPLSRWLHIVCTTLIVGGTLFFELVLPIAIEDLKREQQLYVFARARLVFRWVVWIGVAGLLLSGVVSLHRM